MHTNGTRIAHKIAHKSVRFNEKIAEILRAVGNVMDKLVALKAKDNSLFVKIKQFFDNLLTKIRNAYKGLTPDSAEGKAVLEMTDSIERIQQIFAEALVEASENFQAAEVQKNTTEEDGVKYMVREKVVDVKGNIYEKVIKPGLKVYDSVKHKKKDYISHLHKKIFKRTFNVNDSNGEQITIEFGKDGEIVQKDGSNNPHPVLGELEATTDRLKMIAIINIKDLIKNSKPLTPSSENSHQWLDEGGWRDRISYMTDFDVVYPVILHIPKTRDGRHLLYDVSVLKKEGTSIDMDATALAAPSARAPETTENGLQSAVEVLEPSGDKITQPDAEVKKNSDRDYSYEALTGKPDMVVTTVGGNVPKNRADVVHQAKQNAAKVGKFDPKTGSVSVYVDDIGAEVVLSTNGLKHSLDRRLGVNAPVVLKAGEILTNSIRINEMTPKKEDASASYILVGTARNENGEMYIVRSVINRFSNELASMDVLYAINAKKEPAALLPRLTEKSAIRTDSSGNQAGDNPQGSRPEDRFLTDSTISIADLLDLVNQYFPDILPEDVLKHYGYDARPEGDLGADALYQDRAEESVSNRSLLANALEGLAQNDIEKNKIREYKEKIDLVNSEEKKLQELNAQIKELSFAKGPRDMDKIRKLRDEATKTANRINIYDKQLLRLEASAPLQKVLEREKKAA